MSQVVKRGNTLPLPLNPGYGVNTHYYMGETVGATNTELFVDGKKNYVIALEPSTGGFIEITVVSADTNLVTGILGTSRYHKIVARYDVNRAGVISLSLGGDTFGSTSVPTTPSAVPNNRFTTNISVTIANRSASNYYPHLVILCAGTTQINNWLLEVKVFTLPSKGA